MSTRDRRSTGSRRRKRAAGQSKGTERSARPDRGSFDEKRGVFMISVAAQLADMHPQTLRMYEARGLITPQRSPKNTRLYSYEDVERLRRIQGMTEAGLNLAGVETVLGLEERIERMRSEMGRMRKRAAEMEKQMLEELERVRKEFRAELVPYGAYEPEDLVPGDDSEPIEIPVRRPPGKRASG